MTRPSPPSPRLGASRAGALAESRAPAAGLLIAFEGLDQSGKQTQAELLRDLLVGRGRAVRLLSFPAYETPIGQELARALRGAHDYPADVMQLLYIANRYEEKPQIELELARGTVLVCDRFAASSIAYGEAQGVDPAWLADVQRHLPTPDFTILLDITPEVSLRRKPRDRDRYEQDLALLGRVRESYLRQAAANGWAVIDADRSRDAIAAAVSANIGADRVRGL
jgi:dTMP kinase